MTKRITREQMLLEVIAKSNPENWPTVDEWPETDTSDLEKAYASSIESGEN